MAEARAYVIANFQVHDKDAYGDYEKGFFPILKKHNGEFVTFDDQTETLEGGSPRSGRVVIFSFPSEAAAKSWYNDPEYQALSEHRRAGTQLEFLTIVHGMPTR